jgi:hypothetical protein
MPEAVYLGPVFILDLILDVRPVVAPIRYRDNRGMEWLEQGFFILVIGWAAQAVWPHICDGIGPLFDLKPLTPIYSFNRRFRTGFKSDRTQLDPNPLRHRASDDICPWPRLLAQ